MKIIHTLISMVLMSMLLCSQAFAQDVHVIEDFEGSVIIDINSMSNGSVEAANESFALVENPAPDEVNNSEMVLQFTRAHDGDPWAGFWASLEEAIDMTDMKYIHVQVWKPRISPIRFKVEGGAETDDIEILSMDPQETVDQWENIVFDFGEHGATGEYPVIAFMPDFEDPLELEENFVMYIDNIILSDSAEMPTSTESRSIDIPSVIKLDQNYPNPFNPTTQISYTLTENTNVKLSVYNVLGKHITTLVDQFQASGTYDIGFDATNLSSGTYIYRLEAGNEARTRTMMLIK